MYTIVTQTDIFTISTFFNFAPPPTKPSHCFFNGNSVKMIIVNFIRNLNGTYFSQTNSNNLVSLKLRNNIGSTQIYSFGEREFLFASLKST